MKKATKEMIAACKNSAGDEEPLFRLFMVTVTNDERELIMETHAFRVSSMTARECKNFASAQVAEKFSKKANRRVHYEARPCNGNSQPIRFNPSCYRDLGR